MSVSCKQLHTLVENLPKISWPFKRIDLPKNGIYFFFESGEHWGHGGNQLRIVRVGTHREGNFRSRISSHYLINERRLNFRSDQSAPKDRSIFRKNIGRALLHRENDPYGTIWEIDFTDRKSRDMFGSKRDVAKEKEIEAEVTKIIRERFSFSWIVLEGEQKRMGPTGMEPALIGTLGACGECSPSSKWLGRHSPKPKIVESGLWLEQHLKAPGLAAASMAELAALCKKRCPS